MVSQTRLGKLLTSGSIPNKPNFEVWLHLGSYQLPNKPSHVGGVVGVGGVLDQLKIRLTQHQVELELVRSLATKGLFMSLFIYYFMIPKLQVFNKFS